MTDQRLRSRERAASLDPAAESALLRERVRAGRLSPERLSLLAYVGHVPARAALGWPDVPPRERALAQWLGDSWRELDLGGWVRGLSRWGQSVQVRAAVAAAWRALWDWNGSRHCLCMGSNLNPPLADCPNCNGTGDHDPRPRLALRAARDWLACLCGRHQVAWENAAAEAGSPSSTSWIPRPRLHPDSEEWRWAIRASVDLSGESAVRTAIQQGLTAWALGGEP